MLELDDIAVAALAADEAHAPFARGAHRGAGSRGVVHACMGANTVEHRMAAGKIEARAHPRELHWRAHEGFAQALAIGRVILAVSLAVFIANRAIFTAVVDEFRGQDVADAQRHSVLEYLLVDHGEAVARLYVLNEIDVV